jgi:hypothetical protein
MQVEPCIVGKLGYISQLLMRYWSVPRINFVSRKHLNPAKNT